MQHDFWHNKWEAQQIGFNQSEPNTLLIEQLSALNLPSNSRIFVPLCGKSIDMVWLAKQGHTVIGCELIESAVKTFFEENDIEFEVYELPDSSLRSYLGKISGQMIEIWAGDIFDLTEDDIGFIHAVYDRAALVALPDDGKNSLRRRYVKKVIKLTETAPQLLLNFTVNEDVLDESKGFHKKTFGPPFVIEEEDLHQYYAATYNIKFLIKDEPNDTDVLVNQAWLLTAKS